MIRPNKTSSSTTSILFLILLLGGTAYIFYNYLPNKVSPPTTLSSPTFSKEEIVAIVKDTIKSDPEFIMNILQEHNKNRQEQMVAKSKTQIIEKKQEIESDLNSPVVGNPNGDVIITTFFDINCGYCKRADKVVSDLIASDKNVKIIFKEFPILGESSVLAAKASLAVNIFDKTKFYAFHEKLMATQGAITIEIIENILKDLNIDSAKIHELMNGKDVETEISSIRALATQIGVHGTPAFIINSELLPGALDLTMFKEKISNARKSK